MFKDIKSPLMTESETAEYLRYSRGTLAKLRAQKKGPPYVKLGAYTVRYVRDQIDAWIEANPEPREES